jgi:hypothetical protein
MFIMQLAGFSFLVVHKDIIKPYYGGSTGYCLCRGGGAHFDPAFAVTFLRRSIQGNAIETVDNDAFTGMRALSTLYATGALGMDGLLFIPMI